MLKELVHNKINEAFAEYQEAKNILDGDITPIDAARLEGIEIMLCELIERVCLYQKKMPQSFYIYTDDEGIAHTKVYDKIDMDKFFCEISKRIAFSDCSGEEVTKIYWKGKEVTYLGWQSHMTFQYINSKGTIIWSGMFENWDH